MTRLHFTRIAPANLVDDIVQTFVVAAGKLGHAVSCKPKLVVPDAINVVCFALDLPPATLAPLPRNRCILLNFEPLLEGTRACKPSYLELLRSSYVWDYSARNLARYAELGIPHGFHVPLGHEDEADVNVDAADRLPEAARDIDVLFVGFENRRRKTVLDALRQRGLRVVTNGNQVWPTATRDDHIRRARVVLNMHQFDAQRIVEAPRLAILLRRRKAVVCELYPDSEIQPAWRQAVVGATLHELADATERLVHAPAQREALELRGLELLRQHRHTTSLAPALEDFAAWSRYAYPNPQELAWPNPNATPSPT